MSSFDELCTKMENLDKETFAVTFNRLSNDVVNSLTSITGVENAVAAYLNFLLASVSADGKLTKEEFDLIKPLFDESAGHDVNYEEAVKMFKDMELDDPSEIEEIADTMADIVGLVSPEIKDDIVLLCLMACAVDGKVSDEEKEWISQLIEPLTVEVDAMELINDILDKAGSFVLATETEGKPRMRLLGFKTIFDGKIYFAVGTFKEVYCQLKKNPKCEILARDGDGFLRWDGEAVFSENPRLYMTVGMAMPEIAQMYIDNGWDFGFFTLENDTAEIVNADSSKTLLF